MLLPKAGKMSLLSIWDTVPDKFCHVLQIWDDGSPPSRNCPLITQQAILRSERTRLTQAFAEHRSTDAKHLSAVLLNLNAWDRKNYELNDCRSRNFLLTQSWKEAYLGVRFQGVSANSPLYPLKMDHRIVQTSVFAGNKAVKIDSFLITRTTQTFSAFSLRTPFKDSQILSAVIKVEYLLLGTG